MGIRRFPQAQLELCEQWFGVVETTETWEDLGPVGEGESQSIRVRNAAGLMGVAKPGQPKTDGICRAAHEKIAFDLAHILELPIPPVVLWDRGPAQAANRYLAISAWAFPQAMKWDAAQQKGLITEELRLSAGPAVSAMRVFHTWISETDRKSDHTQVNVDSSDGHLGVAFIDHAYSMSHVWKGPDWQVGECPKYMPVQEVPQVMAETADRIAALCTQQVSEPVNRIPACYLPEPHRGHIISNLLSRKDHLRPILAIP